MFSSHINQKRTGRTSSRVAAPSQHQPQTAQMPQKTQRGNSKKQKLKNDKTCWQFRKGNCKNGERCKWSHSMEKGIVATQHVSGRGRTVGKPFSLPLADREKSDVCWNYKRGNCKNGKNCKWKHLQNTNAGNSNDRYRSNHNSNQWPGEEENMEMWNNTKRRLNDLHLGPGARNRSRYALPPPQPKKKKGPWAREADLPAPKKSAKESELPNSTGKNPISVLCEFSQHKKMPLEWKITSKKKGFKYTVNLDGRFLASAAGSCKRTLKWTIAAKGIAVLERCSRLVELITRLKAGKHAFLVRNEAKAMKKEGLLLLGDPSLSDALKPNNKGYKILLKMGWDPTKGLGKSLQGLTQPVAVELKDNVRLGKNKRGLGYADPSKAEATFTDGAERKVREFANSTLTQMQFSKSLTKEERALIHDLAKKYHVKSKSVGKNENRSLFLFKYTD